MSTSGATSDREFDAGELLDAISHPALLVTTAGEVKLANRAVKELSPSVTAGSNLCQLAGAAHEAVRKFLQRSSGSSGPLVGVVYLPEAGGALRKYQSRARLLHRGKTKMVLVECNDASDDKFSILNRRIEALNAEIRLHLRTKAVLEETLRERELLIREIHHRVKNNIQILHGMLSASENDAENPEAKRSLADARRRLAAMAAVQQTLYQAGPQSHRADEFLQTLVSQLSNTWPRETRIELSVGGGELGNDSVAPLALIINELVTNAVKYGNGGNGALVRISLHADREQVALSVSDSGPGFAPGSTDRKSSGLGLVRGLARQLGGKFSIENRNGAYCALSFPNRSSDVGNLQ